jgi:hypothetical protein
VGGGGFGVGDGAGGRGVGVLVGGAAVGVGGCVGVGGSGVDVGASVAEGLGTMVGVAVNVGRKVLVGVAVAAGPSAKKSPKDQPKASAPTVIVIEQPKIIAASIAPINSARDLLFMRPLSFRCAAYYSYDVGTVQVGREPQAREHELGAVPRQVK